MLLLFKSNAITLQKKSYYKIKDMHYLTKEILLQDKRHAFPTHLTLFDIAPPTLLEFQKLLFYNLLQSNFSHFTE